MYIIFLWKTIFSKKRYFEHTESFLNFQTVDRKKKLINNFPLFF